MSSLKHSFEGHSAELQSFYIPQKKKKIRAYRHKFCVINFSGEGARDTEKKHPNEMNEPQE